METPTLVDLKDGFGQQGQRMARFSSFIMEHQARACPSGRGWSQRRQGGCGRSCTLGPATACLRPLPGGK
jgi:hypothetical protein